MILVDIDECGFTKLIYNIFMDYLIDITNKYQ